MEPSQWDTFFRQGVPKEKICIFQKCSAPTNLLEICAKCKGSLYLGISTVARPVNPSELHLMR